jgi:EVE domain
MRTFWIGVASREHVLRAVKGGFCQLSHGKEAPVRLLHQGDVIIFYSPRERMGDAAPLQAFTALGEVTDEAAFPAKQTEGFHPYRRKVRYYDTETAEIRSLLFSLSFTRDRDHWSSSFRRGSFKIQVLLQDTFWQLQVATQRWFGLRLCVRSKDFSVMTVIPCA